MNDETGAERANVEVVERFLASLDRRWPTEDELVELLAPEVRFVERPNLISPVEIEQHDCDEQPSPPEQDGRAR